MYIDKIERPPLVLAVWLSLGLDPSPLLPCLAATSGIWTGPSAHYISHWDTFLTRTNACVIASDCQQCLSHAHPRRRSTKALHCFTFSVHGKTTTR